MRIFPGVKVQILVVLRARYATLNDLGFNDEHQSQSDDSCESLIACLAPYIAGSSPQGDGIMLEMNTFHPVGHGSSRDTSTAEDEAFLSRHHVQQSVGKCGYPWNQL